MTLTIAIEARDVRASEVATLAGGATVLLADVTRYPTWGAIYQSKIWLYVGVARPTIAIGMLRGYRDGKGDPAAAPRYTIVCAGHRPAWESHAYADDWAEVRRELRRQAAAEVAAYFAWDTTGGLGEAEGE